MPSMAQRYCRMHLSGLYGLHGGHLKANDATEASFGTSSKSFGAKPVAQ